MTLLYLCCPGFGLDLARDSRSISLSMSNDSVKDLIYACGAAELRI